MSNANYIHIMNHLGIKCLLLYSWYQIKLIELKVNVAGSGTVYILIATLLGKVANRASIDA
jgi:hypothetical protein